MNINGFTVINVKWHARQWHVTYVMRQLFTINTYRSYYQFIKIIWFNFILLVKLFRHFVHVYAISRNKHRMSNDYRF